ncbi:D-alanyl-D-alanine carboxypeptidase family protein [Mangrovicoccus algicola]|uniref:serine-type D-Ala-D-Ala carboxypeptidase n=1 Tax=Mangrovicoccus algicola TaxID=2771008 RepID=A0A8J6YVB8_9RHOB|nr:D-alanyl-D-alanine carboxypeptidase family protein [Mangrovicoccus algicola]MBE3639918.1 D-alanyl-D-alanine carboxypeptidase [Mangrovicoccus algicola]
MIRLLLTLVLLLPACAVPARAEFETQATSAYVLDLTTGTVLLDKNADIPLPPASMSKLMTVYMLFEALRDNPNVSLDTRFGVSTKAREMGGSTMFLNERDRPTVDELLHGIIVQSGNDATVVAAEGLAGTEDAFARLMNQRAADLGMTNSTFANASGWPNPIHRMSTHDLAILASRIIEDFPEYYGYFSIPEWDYDGRAPQNRYNRNPLLHLGIGVDGLKTGHTSEAGYGLVGSAMQGDRRIVFVISGLPSSEARAEEGERIVNWAFRQYVKTGILTRGQKVAAAPVWMGDVTEIGLVAPEDAAVLVPAINLGEMTASVEFTGPLEAPITAGAQVADLVVRREGLPDAHLPLVSDRDVIRGGFVPRVRTATNVLAQKLIGQVQGLF